MAELWFRDKQHFETTNGRNAPPEILADRFNEYADFTKVTWLSVTEHVNLDGPTTRETTKLVHFVKRRDGIGRAAFEKCWREIHIPNVLGALRRTPTARRYTVDLVDSARGSPGLGARYGPSPQSGRGTCGRPPRQRHCGPPPTTAARAPHVVRPPNPFGRGRFLRFDRTARRPGAIRCFGLPHVNLCIDNIHSRPLLR
jgi:hypothetical protein